MLLNFLIFQYWSWWYCCRLFVCFFSRFYDLYLFAFGSCYFWLKSANTCTNSILKTRCYSEVNILSTFFTNLAVTTSNIWALFGSSKVFEVAIGNMSIHMDSISRQCEHQSGWNDICYFWYEWQSWGEGKFRVVGNNLVPETESEENNGRRQRKITKKK